MKVKVKDQKGKETKGITLEKSVFEVEVNKDVISQYVYSYLSNQREANASTKDRSEVRGGGRKPWRQKGTGRARFGSSRNPIWTGGGVTFGPSSERNYKKKVTKKFRNAAYRQALSSLVTNDKLTVVSKVEFKKTEEKLTASAIEMLKALDLEGQKVTFVTSEKQDEVIKAFANVQRINVIQLGELNPYDILSAGTLVIEEDAIKSLSKRLKK